MRRENVSPHSSSSFLHSFQTFRSNIDRRPRSQKYDCFAVYTRVYSLFTFVLSENVFCQGIVVLLNPVCVLLSGMLHFYKSDVSVAVLET